MSKPKIVACIPCFNTEPYIGEVVRKAKKYVDEVIVVDDGSHDNTARVAQEAGAKLIAHERNKGKGAAMLTAMNNNNADIIVFLDGDGQHNPEEIPTIVEPIINGKADLVIGSRHLKESNINKPSFLRRCSNVIASIVITLVINTFLPLSQVWKSRSVHSKSESTKKKNTFTKRITDCTSGFRAFRKESFTKLNLTSTGYEIETEMIFEAAKHSLSIIEVPISCHWESHKSGLSIFKDGYKTLKMLCRKLLTKEGNYNDS